MRAWQNGLGTLVVFAGVSLGGGIDSLAPKDSFVVMSVDNWPRMNQTLSESELGALWREASVQAWFAEMAAEAKAGFEESMELVGIEGEDLREPTGAVGLAVFAVEPPPAEAPDEEDLWAPEPPLFLAGMLAYAEFGEDAEAVLSQIDAVLDKGEDDDEIEVERLNHDGVEMIRVTAVEPEPEPLDPDDAEMGEFTPPTIIESIFGPFGKTGEILVSRVDGAILIGNHRPSFEFAIDGLKGRAIESIGEVPTYRDALAQHPAESIARLIVLFDPLVDEYMGDRADDPEEGMTFALLDSLGLLEVRAFGIGLRFDSPDGVMEQSIGVLAPVKKGLLSLFDNRPPSWTPPAFIGADATSAMRICFRFKDVIPTVRAAIQSLPEEQREQASPMFEQAAMFAQPILDAMGEQVHVSASMTRPFSIESERSVVALEISDTLAPMNLLNTFGQGMMTPREFEGNQIYDSQAGFSLGFGFGHAFIGQTAGVEDAMRSAGQPAGPKLVGEDRFTRALAVIPPGAIFASYLDFEVFLRHFYWQMENMDKIMAEQFADVEINDFNRELIEQATAKPAWAKNLPPVEVVLERVGDMVSEIHPTQDGFRGRSLWLAPRK